MMTKHMVQRSLTFLALTGILACTGDPTSELANGVETLDATPGTVFIPSGTTTNIDVIARDGVGNPVEASFTVGTVGAGITVERDLTFEPIRNEDGEFVPNPHPTRVRYNVTATAAASVSPFTIRAGGKDVEVTVVVTPLSSGTLSATTASVGDTLTITATPGLSFTAEAATDVGAVVSVANDGSSLQWLVEPGLTNIAPTVSGVVIADLPDVPLSSVTSNSVTIPATGAIANTTLPTTAPLMGTPAIDATSWVIDTWNSSNANNKFYAIDIPNTAGNYTLTLDWEGAADMDLIACYSDDPDCDAGDGIAAGSDHPESATLDLGDTAAHSGRIVLWVNKFSGANPVWIKVTAKRNS